MLSDEEKLKNTRQRALMVIKANYFSRKALEGRHAGGSMSAKSLKESLERLDKSLMELLEELIK